MTAPQTVADVQHTPGPWKATCHDVTEGLERGDSGIRYWTVSRASGYHGELATVHSALNIDGGITLDERDANARLIMAAPDLLEALEALLHQALQSPDLLRTEYGQQAVEQARAALRAAATSARQETRHGE